DGGAEGGVCWLWCSVDGSVCCVLLLVLRPFRVVFCVVSPLVAWVGFFFFCCFFFALLVLVCLVSLLFFFFVSFFFFFLLGLF
ncbi:hypothetical protein, partial [Salmonella enterica]|uniref:hypothetical protein n=1 Tax=Salmonella enterica TaxID=28901 RepID=UPI001F29B440